MECADARGTPFRAKWAAVPGRSSAHLCCYPRLRPSSLLDPTPTASTLPFRMPTPSCAQGGESEALARLEASLSDTKWVCGFEKPATDPSAFEKPATTVLSPYLKFGCLSPR
jgi:deoxyribodipyrimidine photolyase